MTISPWVPDPPRDPSPPETSRAAPTRSRRLVHLSVREYLPLLATVGLWATIIVAIGTADAARLFAASVALRAILMLTRATTARSIKLRIGAPLPVRRQARRMARRVQLAVLAANFIILAALMAGLDAIGQDEIAFFLPLILLSDSEKFTMPLGLFRSLVAYTNLDYGMLNAMALLYMLPSFLIFLFARQYLIRGTMAGAVAGQ